jgi:hypothetical protein
MKTGVYMSVSAALRLSISVSKNSTRWLRIFLTYTLRKQRGTRLCVFRELNPQLISSYKYGATAVRNRLINLKTGPTFRVTHLSIPADQHTLVQVYPHLQPCITFISGCRLRNNLRQLAPTAMRLHDMSDKGSLYQSQSESRSCQNIRIG